MRGPNLVVVIRIIATLLFFVTITLPQQDPRQLFERARMMQEIGNSQEAIKLYDQVIALAKDDCALASEAQFLVGQLYERLGHESEALRAFKAVKSCPSQTKWVR